MYDHIIRRLDNTAFGAEILDNSSEIDGIEDCPYSVSYVAFEGIQIIGILEICKRRGNSKTVRSTFTMVRPFRHRRGVAKQLWRTMIKTEKPKRIEVTTASNKGYTLIESLQEEFKKIKWEVADQCCHSLRKKK